MKRTTITCPNCKSITQANSACWPFCSERCKTVDLGDWASERYRIPSEAPTDQSDNQELLDQLEEDNER
ncbi:DNA gyrase inhibitor YacG [bacterium]|nr:DNA gyrase inhibitor YacG [bacterium]